MFDFEELPLELVRLIYHNIAIVGASLSMANLCKLRRINSEKASRFKQRCIMLALLKKFPKLTFACMDSFDTKKLHLPLAEVANDPYFRLILSVGKWWVASNTYRLPAALRIDAEKRVRERATILVRAQLAAAELQSTLVL